jgi:Flp pilus assembly protein TadD
MAGVHSNLAVLYWEQGNMQKAVEHIRWAVQLDPQNPDVVVNCARIQEAVGEEEQAVRLLEQYLATQEGEEIQRELERMRQNRET